MVKAYEMPFSRLTVVPAEDFKDKRYTFVTLNEDGAGVTPTAAGPVVGVIQEPNNIGEPAQTMVNGVSFIVCGEAVKAGELIASDAAGKAVKAVAGAGAVGICMVGAGAGEIGSILL